MTETATETLTPADIVEEANRARLASSGGWWEYSTPDGRVRMKGHRTWVQRIVVGGPGRTITQSGPMDCSVRVFKSWLLDFLTCP